jgi:hypothetical protein
MNERIKAMPWGVKVAAVFLLICYIALLFLSPEIWLCLTFLFGLYTAVNRIIEYIVSGH